MNAKYSNVMTWIFMCISYVYTWDIWDDTKKRNDSARQNQVFFRSVEAKKTICSCIDAKFIDFVVITHFYYHLWFDHGLNHPMALCISVKIATMSWKHKTNRKHLTGAEKNERILRVFVACRGGAKQPTTRHGHQLLPDYLREACSLLQNWRQLLALRAPGREELHKNHFGSATSRLREEAN
jgi:hypothetical protein